MAAAKEKEKEKANALEDVSLVASTQQNLSNLYSLDIYGSTTVLRQLARALVTYKQKRFIKLLKNVNFRLNFPFSCSRRFHSSPRKNRNPEIFVLS